MARVPCPSVLADGFKLQHPPKRPHLDPHLMEFTYSLQHRAGVFLAKCLSLAFRPPAVPSLAQSCFLPIRFPTCVLGNVSRQCYHSEGIYCACTGYGGVLVGCYYLAKSNPFSTWILKCRSPPSRPSPFQREASKVLRH